MSYKKQYIADNMNEYDVSEFLNTHRVLKISSAYMEYMLNDDIEVTNEINKFIGSNFDISDEEKVMLENLAEAITVEELLNYMRKPVAGAIKTELRKKVLENEAAIMPMVKEKCMRNLQDIFIENALNFFLHCNENCCEWFVKNYAEFRSEYLKSMFCLILGFRGDKEYITFLINEACRFLKDYPDESYDQGPYFAVEKLVFRYYN